MHRTYTMRLIVNRKQAESLERLRVHCCELYNAALQERKEAWKLCQVNVTRYDQHRQLTVLRQADPELAAMPLGALRDPINRVDLAFAAYFRRCNAGEHPGHPRFKSINRYDTVSICDSSKFKFEQSRVLLGAFGSFKTKTRMVVIGRPLAVHLKKNGDRWVAKLICDIGDAPAKAPVSNAIGIDLGLTTLVSLSDGAEIPNPHWTATEAKRMAMAGQSFSRSQHGSKNRIKARERLRRVHQRIANRRRNYLHEVSRWLVGNYDLIAYENLNIRGMVRSNLAKSILDAAWGELIWQLTYKAECAGSYAIAVNPRGTSQTCSGCGHLVPKGLKVRQHDCSNCGLTLGRDHNAALNILDRGIRSAGLIVHRRVEVGPVSGVYHSKNGEANVTNQR